MDVKEAAGLLRVSKESVSDYINRGIQLNSGEKAFLKADKLPQGFDISESDLDGFISALEADEPGRHPPVRVHRELLIEASWQCAICFSDAPLEFHHIIPWSTLKHHDPQHMLAVCPSCHAKITRYGQPDSASQREIKRRLVARARAAVESSAQRALEPAPAPLAINTLPAQAPPASQMPVATPMAGPDAPPLGFSPYMSPTPQSPPASMATSSDSRKMLAEVFHNEYAEYDPPSDEEVAWVHGRLMSNVFRADMSRDAQLVLRSMRAVSELRKLRHPDAVHATSCNIERLVEVSTEVLVEHGANPVTAAAQVNEAIKFLRTSKLLNFEDVDEWHPGMASGSGWTEYVTLSRAGQRVLGS